MTTAIQSEEQPPVTSEATEVDDHTRPVAALNAPQSSVVQRPQVNLPLPTFMDVQGDDMDAQVETGGVEEELKVPMKGDARSAFRARSFVEHWDEVCVRTALTLSLTVPC
jgi:hypothetical protein